MINVVAPGESSPTDATDPSCDHDEWEEWRRLVANLDAVTEQMYLSRETKNSDGCDLKRGLPVVKEHNTKQSYVRLKTKQIVRKILYIQCVPKSLCCWRISRLQTL